MGWGWLWVCGGCPMHTCMHMQAHTHMHTCTCMLNMINMLNMDDSMSVAICNFYTCIHVCACMCMHAHTCACMWGHPPCPQTPTTHLPPPQSHRELKTPKFNKSSTNQDNSILFEDSLPLNTPELIYTIVDHPGYPSPTWPGPPPELRKPKLEELQ